MIELYWITRLNAICFFIGMLMVGFSILSIIGICRWSEDWGCEMECNNPGKKIFFYSLVAIFILGILEIFIPSERQMYKIYGLGGMKEFIESSEEAKKLPDKTIKALDLFLDRIIEEEK